MEHLTLIERIDDIISKIEHDNYTIENLIQLKKDLNEQHKCTFKLKHAFGYQCPECYKITK